MINIEDGKAFPSIEIVFFLSLQHCDDLLLHAAGSGHDASAALPVLPRLLQPTESGAVRGHHHIPGCDPDTLRSRHPHQLLPAAVFKDIHKGRSNQCGKNLF